MTDGAITGQRKILVVNGENKHPTQEQKQKSVPKQTLFIQIIATANKNCYLFQTVQDFISVDIEDCFPDDRFPETYCVKSVVFRLHRLRSCHDECLVTKQGQHIPLHPRACPRARQPTLSPFPCFSCHQQHQPIAARLHFKCSTLHY